MASSFAVEGDSTRCCRQRCNSWLAPVRFTYPTYRLRGSSVVNPASGSFEVSPLKSSGTLDVLRPKAW